MFAFRDVYLPTAARLTGLLGLLRCSCPIRGGCSLHSTGTVSMTSPCPTKLALLKPQGQEMGHHPKSTGPWVLVLFQGACLESGQARIFGTHRFPCWAFLSSSSRWAWVGLPTLATVAFRKVILGLVLRCFQAEPQPWGVSLLLPLLYVNTTSTLTATVLATFRVAVMKYQAKTTEGSKEGLACVDSRVVSRGGEGLVVGSRGSRSLPSAVGKQRAVTARARLASPFYSF